MNTRTLHALSLLARTRSGRHDRSIAPLIGMDKPTFNRHMERLAAEGLVVEIYAAQDRETLRGWRTWAITEAGICQLVDNAPDLAFLPHMTRLREWLRLWSPAHLDKLGADLGRAAVHMVRRLDSVRKVRIDEDGYVHAGERQW